MGRIVTTSTKSLMSTSSAGRTALVQVTSRNVFRLSCWRGPFPQHGADHRQEEIAPVHLSGHVVGMNSMISLPRHVTISMNRKDKDSQSFPGLPCRLGL